MVENTLNSPLILLLVAFLISPHLLTHPSTMVTTNDATATLSKPAYHCYPMPKCPSNFGPLPLPPPLTS
ncbi:hypothetical protein HanPSC8_Chr12g0507751 [Helianthus annuus]|nr:hypothetical protein HanPSC8_Chr12g0507751 [Helianthus annuus]